MALNKTGQVYRQNILPCVVKLSRLGDITNTGVMTQRLCHQVKMTTSSYHCFSKQSIQDYSQIHQPSAFHRELIRLKSSKLQNSRFIRNVFARSLNCTIRGMTDSIHPSCRNLQILPSTRQPIPLVGVCRRRHYLTWIATHLNKTIHHRHRSPDAEDSENYSELPLLFRHRKGGGPPVETLTRRSLRVKKQKVKVEKQVSKLWNAKPYRYYESIYEFIFDFISFLESKQRVDILFYFSNLSQNS